MELNDISVEFKIKSEPKKHDSVSVHIINILEVCVCVVKLLIYNYNKY